MTNAKRISANCLKSVAGTLRRIGNLVAAYIHWFLGPRLFWLGVLVISNALLFGFYTFRSEVAIRSAGLTLELLGLLVALGGIIETRTFFGLPDVPPHLSSTPI